MAVNTLTAVSYAGGAKVFGQPALRKSFFGVDKEVGAPVLGQPLFATQVAPIHLAVGSPIIPTGLLNNKTLSPVSKTVGAIVFSGPGMTYWASLTAHSFVNIQPVFSRPLLSHRLSAATNLTVASPVLGHPLIQRFFIARITPVNKTVGSLTFSHPAAGMILKIIPFPALASPALQTGSPSFGSPYFTQAFHGGGDMRGLPAEPAQATPYYREVNAIWPDLLNQRAVISPARNGVNRDTGRMLQGWEHVEQSMKVIFATPFHERILRRWVGSYVPYILGETYVARIVTRFFWAISVSIDLWEPNYRIKQVFFMNDALHNWAPKTLDAVGEYRLGHGIFRTEGVYRPRAHLGDQSPYQPRAVALIGRGTEIWDPAIGAQ